LDKLILSSQQIKLYNNIYQTVHTKMSLQGKDLAEIDFNDIEELFAKLTPEELELLAEEVDPDDPYLPASERMKNQTTKADTGPYKRKELLKFLEEQGKNEKDWEQNKPYIKEEFGKGKVYVPPPKEEPEDQSDAYKQVSSDWDEILEGASEADIVELASILGFASLVNQSQYNAAQSKDSSFEFGGWNAAARAEPLKFVAPEPDNSTDVEDSIKRITDNDSTLTSLNLNNIKNISIERMNKLFEALESNTNLKTLNMSNVDMPDSVAKGIVFMLEENKTLLTLNIESNLLTGLLVADICRATLKNQTLIDLRLANQRAQILGTKIEMDIADSIRENDTLLRLGVHFMTLGPRATVQDHLKKNWDQLRLKRVNKENNE
jgi:tropomodulin